MAIVNAMVSVKPYQELDDSIKFDINALIHQVWGDTLSDPEDFISSPHNIEYHPYSCTVYANGMLVSYAAILTFPVTHHGITFLVAGLSCVATAPGFERQGFGCLAVNAATQHILASQADIGLFTCDPPLQAFYARSGWQVQENLRLISHLGTGALCSRELGKVVLLKLVSSFAQTKANLFCDDTLNLGLGSGQFI
ncbi:MAG: GNAT family N-acetyltransferase [Plesiomonas sp.]|uniref:GNAT family N-acetyltransferase n=1 Tax=Plesiomonas sp. TaxID=2486279 RepID=UPI003F2CB3FA